MGITSRSTMVLLSTLAALVIIVNSAQEEYENQYRRSVRPRSLDLENKRFEAPWRTLESEPVMQQSSSYSREAGEDMSPEEPTPRRRRPGRKRNRRPEPSSLEESNERIKYDNRPRFDEYSNEQAPEQVKRRRKKNERRLKWAESLEEDRPMRRRGQRRKRPTLDTFPELSEFGGYRPNQNARPVETEMTTDQVIIEEVRDDDNVNEKQTDAAESSEIPVEHLLGNVNGKHYEKSKVEIRPVENDEGSSDSSNENLELDAKEFKKSQNEKSSSIDPLTLKDILKKSNGTSLSEILQQHNLSLADLLRGKELALSILKRGSSLLQVDTLNSPNEKNNINPSEEKLLVKSETNYVTPPEYGVFQTTTEVNTLNTEDENRTTEDITTTEKFIKETTIPATNRRYPNSYRKQQNKRPGFFSYKSQINRDLVALKDRKHLYNINRRRNVTKSHEWKEIVPLMKNVSEIISEKPKIETTVENKDIEFTTIYEEVITTTELSKDINETIFDEISDTDGSQNETEVIVEEDLNEKISTVKESTTKPEAIQEQIDIIGLRTQAFNNIIKKKRRKQQQLSAQPPNQNDNNINNNFEIPNLVSSPVLIAKTQAPKTNLDDVTILEDFITTEPPNTQEQYKPANIEDKQPIVDDKHRRREKSRKIRYTTRSPSKHYKSVFIQTTTEDSAKIEIDEILSDTSANARLSKILKERNMTLSELVEHRERGSSHVHLADIFHNASKEPNPSEPFLSKSAIEPISKETYPLRALLDAHDTTTKATTVEPVQENDIQQPSKIHFTSKVNEHVENMGIMSLFHNITQGDMVTDEKIRQDSTGTPYKTSITVVNANERDDDKNETDTAREGRAMPSINSNPDDIVGWNEIFSLMRRSYENKTKSLPGLVPAETLPKAFDEDSEVDSFIVLDDMRPLDEFKKVETISNAEEQSTEIPLTNENLLKQHHFMSAKSVTLATASIFGLALVLFLVTYIGYRWWQQRSSSDKNNYPDEIIPTPVFENRKGHKNNSSTRSISPMLTSNIYTLSTLDSQNGKESPDYMWDSLRKPFQ